MVDREELVVLQPETPVAVAVVAVVEQEAVS